MVAILEGSQSYERPFATGEFQVRAHNVTRSRDQLLRSGWCVALSHIGVSGRPLQCRSFYRIKRMSLPRNGPERSPPITSPRTNARPMSGSGRCYARIGVDDSPEIIRRHAGLTFQ